MAQATATLGNGKKVYIRNAGGTVEICIQTATGMVPITSAPDVEDALNRAESVIS